MVKSIKFYDSEGVLVASEDFGANGTNVDITVEGLSATNLQTALTEIVNAIKELSNSSNITTGVTVNNVGQLSIPMGNLSAGTNIDGMTLTELLVSAFGSAS